MQVHGDVILNGLTQDQVLFNVTGSGNALDINDNGGNGNPNSAVQGVFLDPNGAITVVHANVVGRVFGGDSSDMQIVSGDHITQPRLQVVPEPATMTIRLTGAIPLGLLGAFRRRRQVASKPA